MTDAPLARFDMPLEEAITTQRAVRRLKPDPVDDALLLRLIELAQKAPTGSNAQNWEFVIVKDPAVKAQLAKRNRQALVDLRRHRTPREPRRCEDAASARRRAVAGRAPARSARHRDRVPARHAPAVAQLRLGQLLRLDLPVGALPEHRRPV